MNSKECVSRGCALQAAMLSPIFQVRNFDVKDTYPFKVAITWQKEDGPSTSLLFGASEKEGKVAPQFYPSVKSVTFLKTEPFTVTAAYTADSPVPSVRACAGRCFAYWQCYTGSSTAGCVRLAGTAIAKVAVFDSQV
jgi:hypothetical protein